MEESITFHGEKLYPVVSSYLDGYTALLLVNRYGFLGLAASVNLIDYGLTPQPGNIFIKTWSENEGLLTLLQEAGMVGPSVKTHLAGFATAEECELLVKP